MQLFYKQYSTTGKPLIILHGMFGQHANWTGLAKAFSKTFEVYSFDVRNHGQSPHADTMSYPQMAQDIAQTMDAIGLEKADFIGHSMGGKIAMQLALNLPERVNKLVVVDIAPVKYEDGPNQELNALQQIELDDLSSRQQADVVLQNNNVPNKAIRDFLLTNLKRNSERKFEWRMNLSVIAKDYYLLKSWSEDSTRQSEFKGETLFIKGEHSNYLLPEYTDQTLAFFPKAKVKVISEAGHWVHNENPEQFFKVVQKFLMY